MIEKQNKYDCPKCHYGHFITAETDSGNNYCEKCNTKLTYYGSCMVDTEKDLVVEELDNIEPNWDKLRELNSPIAKNPHPTVTCPYCKSTNTHKISGVYKAASIGLFGLFALPGASKQWTCRDCKSDF